MKRETIEAIIIEQAASASSLNAEGIRLDFTMDDLAMDSMSTINFVVGVEDAFDIEINCGEGCSMNSLADVRDLVLTKTAMKMPVAA